MDSKRKFDNIADTSESTAKLSKLKVTDGEQSKQREEQRKQPQKTQVADGEQSSKRGGQQQNSEQAGIRDHKNCTKNQLYEQEEYQNDLYDAKKYQRSINNNVNGTTKGDARTKKVLSTEQQQQQQQRQQPNNAKSEETTVFELCMKKLSPQCKLANAKLCLDGTSCTNKSTILRSSGLKVCKIQSKHKYINANTFGPSLIGYVMGGMEFVTNISRDMEIFDRSPLNVIEWRILWMIMDGYVKRFGNAEIDPDDDKCKKYIRYTTIIFKHLYNSPFYQHFRRKLNVIAIIDSNIQRCDEMRSKRNIGSDSERSKWKFYTHFQNLMYSTLYKDTCIDLNSFGNIDREIIISAIGKCLNTISADLINRITHLYNYSLKHTKPYDDHCPKEALTIYKLPTAPYDKSDYSLRNASVCVYRATGKFLSKAIQQNSVPGNIRCVGEGFVDLIPNFINATDIKATMEWDRIKLPDMEPKFTHVPI